MDKEDDSARLTRIHETAGRGLFCGAKQMSVGMDDWMALWRCGLITWVMFHPKDEPKPYYNRIRLVRDHTL